LSVAATTSAVTFKGQAAVWYTAGQHKGVRLMPTILNVVQIIVSLLLMVLILLQARNAGLGRTFGSDAGSIHRTRRGIEKTLFQLTIALAIAFMVISLATAVYTG
jgi:preprotein translocase subunit SecG